MAIGNGTEDIPLPGEPGYVGSFLLLIGLMVILSLLPFLKIIPWKIKAIILWLGTVFVLMLSTIAALFVYYYIHVWLMIPAFLLVALPLICLYGWIIKKSEDMNDIFNEIGNEIGNS